MAKTTFSGPVVSTNGFVGAFTGGTTNLELSGTLEVDGTSTLTGAVTAPGGVTGNVTGNLTGDVTGDVTGNVTGYVIFPTADPMVVGAWWNNAGVLTISAAV